MDETTKFNNCLLQESILQNALLSALERGDRQGLAKASIDLATYNQSQRGLEKFFHLLAKMVVADENYSGLSLDFSKLPTYKSKKHTSAFKFSELDKTVRYGKLLEDAGRDNSGERAAALKEVHTALKERGENVSEQTLDRHWMKYIPYRQSQKIEMLKIIHRLSREQASYCLSEAAKIFEHANLDMENQMDLQKQDSPFCIPVNKEEAEKRFGEVMTKSRRLHSLAEAFIEVLEIEDADEAQARFLQIGIINRSVGET